MPRAELYAILLVHRHAVSSRHYGLAPDSKANVDLHLRGNSACMDSCNSALWPEFFNTIRAKHLDLDTGRLVGFKIPLGSKLLLEGF